MSLSTGDRIGGSESRKTAPPLPPTDYELDMAITWTVLNAVRLFHNVRFEDVTKAEEKFRRRWLAIPAKRRKAALDFDILRESRLEKMREVANW